MFLIKILMLSTILFLGLFAPISTAHALRYDRCQSPQESLPCAVAFEKLRTQINPLTQKKYFENGLHIQGNKLMKVPYYHIAQPDLDNDGVKEIIVVLSGATAEEKKLFCKNSNLCAHYIIQNRNPDPNKPRLRDYHILGKSHAYGIGLSTDEKFHNYKSLRVYKSGNANTFNVYQYDKKEDQYFNLGQQSGNKS